jgi:fatty-acyl-CoA synthase
MLYSLQAYFPFCKTIAMIYQQDWLARWAMYSPQKIALKEFETGRTATYSMLNKMANRVANRLTYHYKINKGDRIAVLADFCIEYVILFSAAQKAGFVLVPLNYRLAPPEISYMLQNSMPKLVIAEDKYKTLLTPEKQIDCWRSEDFTTFCFTKENISEDELFPLANIEDDDPLFLLYTSGTTSFPKGAIYSYKMLFWNSINTSISLIINQEGRTINFAPPFHTGGWNVLLTPFLHHGGYICMLKKFDASTILHLLQEENITIFFGVPTMLKMIADEPDFEAAQFPNLHYVVVGGEPMPIPLIERWGKKNIPIRQGYGMTEVGPNLTSLHQDDATRKKGSIGRPNFYVQIKVVDENGQDCPPGVSGELWLSGPIVTPGYWQNEEATVKAFSGDKKWFRSGDIVIRDEENYLFVVDRLKNMFISGGENVYPAELERVLLQHPSVSEAAVIGVPDEKWGEVGKAFIVIKKEMHCTAEELMNHCKNNLAKFKIPKHIVFIEVMPKNDSGKINRMMLKKTEMADKNS